MMRSLLIFCCLFGGHALAQEPVPSIALNQLGYWPASPKEAVIIGNINAKKFYLLGANADTVYKGDLPAGRKAELADQIVRIADFSSFKKTGRYKLYVPGVGSTPVEIQKNVFDHLSKSVIKAYYFQRASMPLDAKYAGKWARAEGHPDNEVLVHPGAATSKRPAGTKISTPGGWYDAGDYNKYIVNSGITMGTLLSAYEEFPGHFDYQQIDIPSTKKGLPALLEECLYNLRWMLSMQDPDDGGVYNKCTHAHFDGMVMPAASRLPRYVVAKGTAATLDFAAVMAQASRIYRKQVPSFADSCLQASRAAYKWALMNPAVAYDQDQLNTKFEPKITTGGYGDHSFDDEWFWASCELYVTTTETVYAEKLKQWLDKDFQIPSWSNVHMLGVYTLLRFQAPWGLELASRLLDYAKTFVSAQQQNPYGCPMGNQAKDFNWGSNANDANQGVMLIKAYQLSNDRVYLDAALSNLDYILGKNATGYCFVTGAGQKSPMHPHHRPSEADGITDPVPGWLVGGPNGGMQDRCKYPSKLPARAYTDQSCSYASNEVAINWNAPLVYLTNALVALKQTAGYVSR